MAILLLDKYGETVIDQKYTKNGGLKYVVYLYTATKMWQIASVDLLSWGGKTLIVARSSWIAAGGGDAVGRQ